MSFSVPSSPVHIAVQVHRVSVHANNKQNFISSNCCKKVGVNKMCKGMYTAIFTPVLLVYVCEVAISDCKIVQKKVFK